MTKIKIEKKKKKRMAGQFWKKRLFIKTFFTSLLPIAREMRKTKGKNPDKMCWLIFMKICSQ